MICKHESKGSVQSFALVLMLLAVAMTPATLVPE